MDEGRKKKEKSILLLACQIRISILLRPRNLPPLPLLFAAGKFSNIRKSATAGQLLPHQNDFISSNFQNIPNPDSSKNCAIKRILFNTSAFSEFHPPRQMVIFCFPTPQRRWVWFSKSNINFPGLDSLSSDDSRFRLFALRETAER